jgi:hypothetical protein
MHELSAYGVLGNSEHCGNEREPGVEASALHTLDHPARRLLVHIREFFIRSGLYFYCFFDSSSHESQKSTPDYIHNYAAYETCGQ